MELVQPIRERSKIEAMKKFMEHNKRDLLMLTLWINCGLRISDILSLQVGDVIDPRGRLKAFFEARVKKTGNYRRIVLSDNVKKVIAELPWGEYRL